jgi:rhodanese-related sulfurtransferase
LTKVFKLLAASFVAVFAVAGLTGCTTQEPLDMTQYAAVIDVRTPGETSMGYLEGAQLFDIQNPTFMDMLSTLDPAADYYIYCRSGNRAGQAIDVMKQAGFTGELVNGGSLENAANQTGLTVVK